MPGLPTSELVNMLQRTRALISLTFPIGQKVLASYAFFWHAKKKKTEIWINASRPIGQKRADMPKPHDQFRYMRADEVAECWDGVPSDLYARLWNDIVPLQAEIPNLEDSGPHDHIGHENLAAHWHILSEADQTLLNALAVAQDAEFDAWDAEYQAMRNAPRLGRDND